MKSICTVLIASFLLLPNAGADRVARPETPELGELHQAVLEAPQDAATHLRYGRALMRYLRFNEAHQQAQAAIAIAPTEPQAWGLAARALLRLGRAGEATTSAKKAVELGDDSGAAAAVLEKVAASSRLASAVVAPSKDGETVVDRFFDACAAGKWAEASSLLVSASRGVVSGQTLAAYHAYLSALPGVSLIGREIEADGDDALRLRLLWRVEPASIDLSRFASLPPAYLEILPLSWLRPALEITDAQVRATIVARATGAWTEVTLATVRLEGGKIKGVRVEGLELFDDELPVVAAAAPSEDAPLVDEKSLRREMFRNRYGKQKRAAGEPYRYRQILLGLAISAVMALFLVWIVRRELRKGR